MSKRYVLGFDISTQSAAAGLIEVAEESGAPAAVRVSAERVAVRALRDASRADPSCWVTLLRECLDELAVTAPESRGASAIGVSTTFPGVFAICRSQPQVAGLASLYDNADDAGICSADHDAELADAELETMNRMYPGNMLIGLAHLVRSGGLRLEEASALVPPNTAFAAALLQAAGAQVPPRSVVTDFTEAVIGCLYDARTGAPMPERVCRLMRKVVPEAAPDLTAALLPGLAPAWRNVLVGEAVDKVRVLLDLPALESVAIGAGDSALGALALLQREDAIVNVRGSSDSPMLVVPELQDRLTPRETVLHYPLPTAASLSDGPWCATAPILRTGRVWDWVRRLRFDEHDSTADAKLEELAMQALKRRLMSEDRRPMVFNTALGGERAPGWDPDAAGSISGLTESHDIGDIALAALEGMSTTLRQCIRVMEDRYGRRPEKMILAGGPVANRLWNWISAVFTGKRTLSTTFANASLLGAAMVGYASLYDGSEEDALVSERLRRLAALCAESEVVGLREVEPPDAVLGQFEQAYRDYAVRSHA